MIVEVVGDGERRSRGGGGGGDVVSLTNKPEHESSSSSSSIIGTAAITYDSTAQQRDKTRQDKTSPTYTCVMDAFTYIFIYPP